MLTRAGVGRRLGKSIATVRRMEGVELHPTVDGRGVHWFDLREVDAIAASGTRGTRHRVGLDATGTRAQCELQHLVDEGLDPSAEADDAVKAAGRSAIHMAEARVWAEQARVDAIAIREERNRLGVVRREELAALAKATQELSVAKQTLIAELEQCDKRTLRRLTDTDLAEILVLLEAECDRAPFYASRR